MSYILEALRRADAERERGAVPHLHTQPAATHGSDESERDLRRVLPWIAAALLLALGLGAAAALWLAQRSAGPSDGRAASQQVAAAPAPTTAPSPPAPAAATPGAAPPPSSPPPLAAAAAPPATTPATTPAARPSARAQPPQPQARAATEPEPRSSRSGAQRSAASPAPARAISPRPATNDAGAAGDRRAAAAAATPSQRADVPGLPPETPQAAGAVRGNAPVARAPGAAPPAGTAAAQGASAAPRVHTLAELPADIRRDLPRLAVGASMYDERPSRRMLVINGQVLREGEKLSPDLIVERIQLRSAVLNFRGWRYELAY